MASTRRFFVYFWGPALLVLGLAFWLRYESAQQRQFHADEGVQAYQAWRLIEGGEYRYDPSEHHGPLLYYATKALYPLLGDDEGRLTDLRIRMVPVLFSLATLLLGLSMFRKNGSRAALLWGLFFATAPVCVIYGGYFVQEALLGCFTLGWAFALFSYLKKPEAGKALWMGVFLGLMHVTKETAVLHVFASFVAILVCAALKLAPLTIDRSRWAKDFSFLTAIVAGFHILFFSSFFQNPAGIWDGVTTFFNYANRAGGAGHEKGLGYYASLFWPQTRGGVWWGELGLLIAAMVSFAGHLFRSKNALASYFSVFAIVLFIVYSIIPYKTPWLFYSVVLIGVYPIAVFLVQVQSSILDFSGWWRWGVMGAFAVLLLWWGSSYAGNLRKAVFRYPSDERNPYLYVHTTPQYQKLLQRIDEVEERVPIEIYSPDAAWPLPWHLRNWANVGYWQSFEERSPRNDSIIIADTRLAEGSQFLEGEGFWELHGLRPNTLLVLRAPEDVADVWIRK